MARDWVALGVGALMGATVFLGEPLGMALPL